MTKYAVSKVHLEGTYGEIVEMFPSFQRNYDNLKRLESTCRKSGMPSIRFVQNLTDMPNWIDMFNEDYLVDTVDGLKKLNRIYPDGYESIDDIIKKLTIDKIDNMIIVGKLANCCVVQAAEIFATRMGVSVVKDAIFDELAYFSSACKRLKPYLVTTQEIIKKL
jgi:hypothetical protein